MRLARRGEKKARHLPAAPHYDDNGDDVMKQCTACLEQKALDEFVKKSSSKDGRAHWCRICRKKKKREEYERNRDRYLARAAEYRRQNPERVSEAKRQCYQAKREQYLANSRRRYNEKRDEILAYHKEYRAKNRERLKQRHRDYNRRNRLDKLRKQARYYRENREARLKYHAEYGKRRRKSDPLYALSYVVRRRITLALSNHGYKKSSRTHEMLGCDYASLMEHLESQFTDGMTWENRGEWHIDHIIPLASASTEEELLALCHYTNLQPLWAFENLSKGAKMPETTI